MTRVSETTLRIMKRITESLDDIYELMVTDPPSFSSARHLGRAALLLSDLSTLLAADTEDLQD